MIRPSFIPSPEIRRLRDLTRYRVSLAWPVTRRSRAEKLLEDAQIKMSVAVTDIFGVSGRKMLAASTVSRSRVRTRASCRWAGASSTSRSRGIGTASV